MTAVQAPPAAALRRIAGVRHSLARLRHSLARVRHSIAGLRHTSPGRLRLLLVILVILSALTGLVAGLSARSATVGTADLRDRAQPLLAETETIYSALADADSTAAQAFITGGLEPPELTRRYDERLAAATSALVSAARRVPAGGEAAAAIRAINTGLGDYTALVATARALNRQGKPVGAAYLSTASQLSRDVLQPHARLLLSAARQEAGIGYNNARSAGWLVLLVPLLVLLTVALVWTQVHLSRSTRRTFNVPLLAASALTLVLTATCSTIFAHQWVRLASADRDGSGPVEALAEMRITVLRERANEALTLASRAGHGPLEDEFAVLKDGMAFDARRLDDVRGLIGTARSQHDAYVALHAKVRELDDGGDYEGAVRMAVGAETAAAFDDLTATLGAALADRTAAFDADVRSAGRGLGLLTVLGPLLALAIGVFAANGLRARLEEYR